MQWGLRTRTSEEPGEENEGRIMKQSEAGGKHRMDELRGRRVD